jgi:signal transduction histidine kinase
VEIDVSDEGPGFDAEIAERAFERFTRASESRSGEGAGLGLAIVRAIVDAHGGRAEIVETPSGGTVRLLLPAAETDGLAPSAPPTLAESPSQAPLI